jgi:meiotically up-regulated gene 157 (Mug157) protein
MYIHGHRPHAPVGYDLAGMVSGTFSSSDDAMADSLDHPRNVVVVVVVVCIVISI